MFVHCKSIGGYNLISFIHCTNHCFLCLHPTRSTYRIIKMKRKINGQSRTVVYNTWSFSFSFTKLSCLDGKGGDSKQSSLFTLHLSTLEHNQVGGGVDNVSAKKLPCGDDPFNLDKDSITFYYRFVDTATPSLTYPVQNLCTSYNDK